MQAQAAAADQELGEREAEDVRTALARSARPELARNATCIARTQMHLNNAMDGTAPQLKAACKWLMGRQEFGLLGSKYKEAYALSREGELVITHHDTLYKLQQNKLVRVPKELLPVAALP